MKKLTDCLARIILLCLITVSSCSKKSVDTPKAKDDVSISTFVLNGSSTLLFKEQFNGLKQGYSNVVLVPDVNSPAVLNFDVTTSPASYATSITYLIKNDDGTSVPATAFTIAGNQIKFNAPGSYRIGAQVQAATGNNASLVSAEVKVQVASNIPDDNTRAELKKISTLNFIGEILKLSSAAGLHRLNLGSLMLKSLSGVDHLTDVDTLYCDNNNLNSLDVSAMTNLKLLYCNSNQLSSLNVKGLPNLLLIACFSNQLTSIDIQGLTTLKTLDISSNNLSILNLQGLLNLAGLIFYNNQLTSIDLTGLNKLSYLDCSGNQMTSLNVNGLTNLTTLACINNKFTSLSVQNLSNLFALSCYSAALTSLNLNTATGSYPNLVDLRVSVSLQCTAGIKQIKTDRGTLVSIRTFNADGSLNNNNFDASICP